MPASPFGKSLYKICIGVAISSTALRQRMVSVIKGRGWDYVFEPTARELKDPYFWKSEKAPEILVIDSSFVVNNLTGKQEKGVREIGLLPLDSSFETLPCFIVFNEMKSFRLFARDNRRIVTQFIAGLDVDALVIQLEQQAAHRLEYLRHLADLERAEEELRSTQRELVERLAMSIEARDQTTGSHVRRMQKYARLLAEKSNLVPPEEYELLEQATALHDIGKLAIMDCILSKPKKLDPNEYAIIQTHAIEGAKILAVRPGGLRMPLLEKCCEVACSHHEKWNGDGYPHRLKGDQIPLWGRLVAVVDVFDALVNTRPYKPGWEFADAIEEIRKGGLNGQFDPVLAKIFVQNQDEVKEIYQKFKDEEKEQEQKQKDLEEQLKKEGRKPPPPLCQ